MLPLQPAQRVRSVRGVLDGIAELLQVLGRDRGDLLVVLHQQHDVLVRSCGIILGSYIGLFGVVLAVGLLGGGKIDADGRAVARLAADRRRSPGLLGKSVYLAQTEPCPLARAFGGERCR